MKSLAKGQSSDAIFKLIKVLISTQQQDYQEAIGGDTNVLADIADDLQTDQQLFSSSEVKPAGVMDQTFMNFVPEEDEIGNPGMVKGVPRYVLD